MRYDAHVQRRDSLPSPARLLTTQKPRAPVIQYQLLQPTAPVGPLDIVTIPLVLRPLDPAVIVRSATLVVERRIELCETSQLPTQNRQSSSSPSPSPSPNVMSGSDGENSSGSTFRGLNHDRSSRAQGRMCEPSTSTAHLLSPHSPNAQFTSNSLTSLSSAITTDSTSSSRADERPLLTPIMTDLPAKTVSLTVAHVDSTGPFSKDPSGAYSKSLTLQWPASKSNSHWAMGETMQTEMIRVRFFIHVKVSFFRSVR